MRRQQNPRRRNHTKRRIVTNDAPRPRTRARLNERKPGDEIRLTVFRNDDLRNVTIKLGVRPPDSLRVVPVKSPTAAQSRLYGQWMGAPLQSLR